MRSLGWEEYTNAVGLRADEPHRVHRMKGDRKAETVVMPMYQAGHGLADVRGFWAVQGFDLRLPLDWSGLGNCVGCFLKGPRKLAVIARRYPEQLAWWARWEATPVGGAQRCATFRNDRPPYAELLARADAQRGQGDLFPDEDTADAAGEDMPCMCTE